MMRLRNWRICLVALLFGSVSPSFCRELHFDSTDRYNIRRGEQEENADLVRCKHGLTVRYSFGPACFKRNSFITVSLVLDNTPEDRVVVDWYHVENGLYRAIGVDSNGNVITEDTAFMSLPVQEQGQGVSKVFIMGPLPNFIEWCVLKVRVIFVHQGKQGRAAVSALHWCEIFTVLDEPKAPMNPAWVSVLRISCRWARGETTPDGAANTLTQRLWDEGEYNGGRLAYTRYICTSPGSRDWNIGEVFYLKAFINQNNLNGLPPGKPTGQCNDFADFLVCLITSVGAFNAVAQRTHPLGLGWWFHYREIDPAGTLSPQEGDWNYHQFCVYGSDVWDGCLAFVAGSPQGVPKKLARDTVYYNGLVDYYHYGQRLPTPTDGFVPIVTAQDLPPSPPPGYQEPACNRGCGGGGPLCTW